MDQYEHFNCTRLVSEISFNTMQQRKTTTNRAESLNFRRNGSVKHSTVQVAETYCPNPSHQKWQLYLPTDKIDTPDFRSINQLNSCHWKLLNNYHLRLGDNLF